ncbi:MAG: MFS transporter, partial [Methyloceanibacter sp.]
MDQDQARQSAIAKATRRLIPFLCLCYAVNFLDRVNVGFAALAMNEDLGFTTSMFGAGAGIFFVGYILFEIPSNLALQRFGARIWIARIMISWGLLSAAMALVHGQTGFYVVRFLLGFAEAGFFPGIIYYLTCWFPPAYRARIIALFLVALPLSAVIGAPVSTALLDV